MTEEKRAELERFKTYLDGLRIDYKEVLIGPLEESETLGFIVRGFDKSERLPTEFRGLQVEWRQIEVPV